MSVKKLIVLMLLVTLLIPTLACGGDSSTQPVDSDGDGWTDDQERIAGTNPYNVDTDGDGSWDSTDPNPLDPNIPGNRSTPIPTPTIWVTPPSAERPVGYINRDDGHYTYTMENAETESVEGRVFVQGDPLSYFPPSEAWYSEGFPMFIPGKVIVVFGYIEEGDPYIYVDIGKTWVYEGYRSHKDIYYYTSGYEFWKLEDVPGEDGKVTRLPDAVLQPRAEKLVLYPEGESSYR